jgi:hypothetical protein
VNRQGKSKLNELLTQLGIPTTKKTRASASRTQADKVWVDEMLEQRMQDAVDNTSDDVYDKIAKAHSFTYEGVLERYKTEQLDKQQNV